MMCWNMSSSKKTKSKEQPRLIKLFVEPDDHDRIRLAAALKRTGMAEFAKSVVLAEARRLTAGIDIPTE